MKKIIYFVSLLPVVLNAMDLNTACSADNIDYARELIAADPDALNSYDKDGFLPIHYAASEGSINVLNLILEKNPNLLNAQDKRGNIPFMHIFLGIYSLQQKIQSERVARQCVKMGILNRVIPIEEMEKREAKRFDNYKKTIDLFISKGAKLDKPNNFNKKWTDIPGLDDEFANYAQEAIKKSRNT